MPATVRLPQRLLLALCLSAGLLAACATHTMDGGPPAAAGLADAADAADAPVLAAFTSLGFYPAVVAPHTIRLDLPSEEAFAPGSADLTVAMQRSLDAVAGVFNGPLLRGWQLLAVGHADDRGSDAENQEMSVARATSAVRHLQARGTDAARLGAEGRGEREPLATNDQRYGRALNRRVELFLTPGAGPPAVAVQR